MSTNEIPEGFARHDRKSPLTDPWEPLYSKRTEQAVIIGLRLAKPHTNGRGLIHGGLIAALADNAMGHSCAHRMGGVSSLVTIGLAVDFVGTAEVGQWLAVESEVVKTGRDGLLRAEPGQGGRRRDRTGQRDVSRGAEAGALVLKRDETTIDRHRALGCCLSMIFSENRFTLFRIMP